MDISAIILSDLKLAVKDDYSNIEKLKERHILSLNETNVLIEANGLRNRVVHKYNSVDTNIFIEHSKELLVPITNLLHHLKNYIENG